MIVLAHVGVLPSMGITLSASAAAAAYAIGDSRLRHRHGYEPLAFGAGLLVVCVALIGPFDAWAETGFAPHMVQHLLLMNIGALLLVLGGPGRRFARTGYAPVERMWRRGRFVRRALRHPGVGWTVFAVVMWTWHAPALYDLAVRRPAVHALEHGTMLLCALWFWSSIADAIRRRHAGIAAISLAITGLHSGALGALLVFAPTVLIASYGNGTDHEALRDQQLAGLWMWIMASPVILVGVLVAVAQMLRTAERTALRYDPVPA